MVKSYRLVLLAAGSLFFASGASSADDGSVTGSWLFVVDSSLVSGTPTITLEQKGEDLLGKYKGQFGEAPVSGSVKGNAFTMIYSLKVLGVPVKATYKGVLNGNTINGKLSMDSAIIMGSMSEGTFRATKL